MLGCLVVSTATLLLRFTKELLLLFLFWFRFLLLFFNHGGRFSLLFLNDSLLRLSRGHFSRAFSGDIAFDNRHEEWFLALSFALESHLLGQFFFGDCLLLVQVDFGHVDGESVVELVELEELLHKFSTNDSRSCGQHSASIGVLPVEARALAFLDLVLVVDDFEDARAELGTELSEDAVGFKGLDD